MIPPLTTRPENPGQLEHFFHFQVELLVDLSENDPCVAPGSFSPRPARRPVENAWLNHSNEIRDGRSRNNRISFRLFSQSEIHFSGGRSEFRHRSLTA